MKGPGTSPPVGAITADIFLGISAVLLVVLTLISASLRDAVLGGVAQGRQAETEVQLAVDAAALSDGGQTVVFVGASGVRLMRGGAQVARAATDDILSDPRLSAVLSGAQDRLLVVIAGNGQEAAFLLDPLLARLGIGAVERIRLDPRCTAFTPTATGVRCNGA